MTREEAINFGEMFLEVNNDSKNSSTYEFISMALKLFKQEPCEDCISRAEMLKYQEYLHGKMPNEENYKLWKYIKSLPSVTPKQKAGHWFYDKSIDNWRCSECNETPKTMGYCGSANFMAKHFKFCNHCGAKMVEPQESEKTE